MAREEAVITHLKLFGISLLILVIGLFSGCSDLRFWLSGENADATFMEFSSVQGRRGRSSTAKYVRYTFVDKDGKKCMGYDTVSIDWDAPAGGVVPIRYIPGKLQTDRRNTVSRLQSSSGFAGIAVLFVGLLATIVFGFTMFRTMENSRPR